MLYEGTASRTSAGVTAAADSSRHPFLWLAGKGNATGVTGGGIVATSVCLAGCWHPWQWSLLNLLSLSFLLI